ncbi:hypothetical protein G7Z17_g3765 [Cylindrodendrum hubeiense]|uniref:Uncharacterized protein n=1 Tax=Cylindrodendrum hubeiense TaxID=595255 RepID=A0A9P5HA46_9HYPO|nr:hypothetical protein G7Z17_g3765 [Cylindrodendrum hubeiense]
MFRNFLFRKCDVSDWNSVLRFFKDTYNVLGPIDAVISNAAINLVESLDDDIDAATGDLKAPDLSVLNVNAVGTCKAAVMGFMRALRTQLPKDNITVNMIAPWMTITPMVTDHIRNIWGDLPANSPLDVAKASLLPVLRSDVNGKSFLINGGHITEVEDKLNETQSAWLGDELSQHMREGQRRLIP